MQLTLHDGPSKTGIKMLIKGREGVSSALGD